MRRCGLRYKEVITERQAGMWYKMCARGSRHYRDCLLRRMFRISIQYLELLPQTNPGVVTIDHHATSRCFLSILPASADYNGSRLSSKCKMYYGSNRQK